MTYDVKDCETCNYCCNTPLGDYCSLTNEGVETTECKFKEEKAKEKEYQYLREKRQDVLKEIKPICDAFGIEDFDYEIKDRKERLRINDTRIGCSSNSISAIVDELIGYIFVLRWSNNRYLGAFKTQTLNVIKEYWIKE